MDQSEHFVYAQGEVALVFDGGGSLTNRYLHGPEVDQVFSDENALGEVLWPLADHQGTVRDLAEYDAGTDTTTVVNHRTYDSFGHVTAETNAAVEHLFAYTGREWDADAELYNYRARWYDAGLGRFLSEDPLGFAAGDVNLTRYVGNSPTNGTDPSGEFPLGGLEIQIGIIVFGIFFGFGGDGSLFAEGSSERRERSRNASDPGISDDPFSTYSDVSFDVGIGSDYEFQNVSVGLIPGQSFLPTGSGRRRQREKTATGTVDVYGNAGSGGSGADTFQSLAADPAIQQQLGLKSDLVFVFPDPGRAQPPRTAPQNALPSRRQRSRGDSGGDLGYGNPFTRFVGEYFVRSFIDDERLARPGGWKDDLLLTTRVVTEATSLADPTGISDLANAGTYLADGEAGQAALVAGGAFLPFGLEKAGRRLLKHGDKIDDVVEIGADTAPIVDPDPLRRYFNDVDGHTITPPVAPVPDSLPSPKQLQQAAESRSAGELRRNPPTGQTQTLRGVPFHPLQPVRISDAHSVNTITSRTRFGGGNRNTPKTVARGDVDLASDVVEINSGRATQLPNGDILTSSGRIYGQHPGQPGIFPRSGSPGTVDLSQAEFEIFRQMTHAGGLTGNVRRAFDGMIQSGNSGLNAGSAQKLIGLFNSRR